LAIFSGCSADPVASSDDAGETEATDSGSTASTSGSGPTEPTTTATGTTGTTGEPPALDTYGFAGGCFSLRSGEAYLSANSDATSFAFAGGEAGAARFTMKAADLGTYLLYDQDGGYLVADDGPLVRLTKLDSDVTLIDDSYVSGAEWALESSTVEWGQYQLHNLRSDQLLGVDALASEGAPVTFEPASGCKPHPELTLDATGQVTR